jgi:dihydrodipicolinate synthase/N-acetylneuraminate lyase
MVQQQASESRDRAGVAEQRRIWIHRLFPGGIPRLWCPTLTHFRAARTLDEPRIGQHLQRLAAHAGGILVPGSTGEGWQMSDQDIRQLLSVVLKTTRASGTRVLIGVLKSTVEQVLSCMDQTLQWLESEMDAGSASEALVRSGVVGFTVCPPRGEHLSQTEIRDSLALVLERGLPVALYQLPQVTGNEMSPETVADLAARFPNLLVLKDTSGQDRVALSECDLGGLFLVRGAEGGYDRWTRAGGGPYHGLLLSTANVFAPQFDQMLQLLDTAQSPQARELAQRIETVVQQTFDLVSDFAEGNPFTNANKVLDCLMTYGSAASDRQPPLLYDGTHLPVEYIERAEGFLRTAGLFPETKPAG